MTKDTESLLRAFENATVWAWQADCSDRSSDKLLNGRWSKQKDARAALIRRIEELEQCLAHDSAP